MNNHSYQNQFTSGMLSYPRYAQLPTEMPQYPHNTQVTQRQSPFVNPPPPTTSILSEHQSLLVQQKTKGWFQEMLGCEAPSAFNITTQQDKQTVLMYAMEESSCLIRHLLGGMHAWSLTLWQGAHSTGSPVAMYHRPCRILPMGCKCCCYQEIQHKDVNGVPIGATTEDCWYCVPRFSITDAHGQLEYILSRPTCWHGTCVDWCAEGICTFRVPFYLFAPGVQQVKGNENGKVVKVWTGLTKELFTDADNLEVDFPKESNENARVRIMGSSFLINQLYFEGKGQDA